MLALGRTLDPARTPRRYRPARTVRYAVVAAATLVALGVVPSSQAKVADGTEAAFDQFTPLAASVVAAPRPVPGADGRTHLAYELLLLNFMPSPVRVDRLEVLDGRRPGRILADLGVTALDQVMASVAGAPGRTMGAAQAHRAILDVQVSPGAPVPRSVVHRLTVHIEPPEPSVPTRFLAGRTAVAHDRPVVLGPPLPGRRWVHLAGCCTASGHRLAVAPVNGGVYAAQRFAADITQLAADGRLVTGPPDRLTSFPAYGTPVLAVADGVVVAVRTDMPDQVPLRPGPATSAHDAPGNRIVLAIGGGRYVMYGHLRPGSFQVSVGDRVRRGQPLAQVGNSGNSDLPHLHLHVMASPSPLGSDGLPYVLRSFDSPGSVPPLDDVDLTRPIPVGPELRGHHERSIPMDRQVVDFPPAG
jgi:hypothetical protein